MSIVDDVILHHDSHATDEQKAVIVAKSVAMVVLFFASLTFGLLPLFLSRQFHWIKDNQTLADIKSSNSVIVGLLSIGGGVLFATTFLHLLPEIAENIKELQEKDYFPEFSFHLESLLMCSGFFLMYLVEELVHLYIHKRSEKQAQRSESVLVRTLSIRHSIINNKVPRLSNESSSNARDPERVSEGVPTIIPPCNEEHSHSHKGRSHSHLPIIDQDDDPVLGTLRGLLIVMALSVHELFEGLAVGLESSSHKVWYMFGAVSAHKFVIAFCVGVQLVTTKTRPLLCFLFTLTFAIVSPIGIGIGLGLAGGDGASASGPASVILQGLACGTLLYVVFFEILQRDRAGLVQLLCTVTGFFIMFGIQILIPHEHSHHEHCDEHDLH